MSFFRPEAYRRINYEVWEVTLSGEKITRAFIGADFIDIAYSTADLSKVYISFNGGEFMPVSAALPAYTAFGLVKIVWDTSEEGKKITFVVGHDYFRSAKQSVSILADYSGIKLGIDKMVGALSSVGTDRLLVAVNLDNTKVVLPTAVRSTKVTISGEAIQPLVSGSFPTRKVYIRRDSGDTGTVYIGDENRQDYPLDPGDKLEIYIDDLSKIYVRVPLDVTANIYVLYEARTIG